MCLLPHSVEFTVVTCHLCAIHALFKSSVFARLWYGVNVTETKSLSVSESYTKTLFANVPPNVQSAHVPLFLLLLPLQCWPIYRTSATIAIEYPTRALSQNKSHPKKLIMAFSRFSPPKLSWVLYSLSSQHYSEVFTTLLRNLVSQTPAQAFRLEPWESRRGASQRRSLLSLLFINTITSTTSTAKITSLQHRPQHHHNHNYTPQSTITTTSKAPHHNRTYLHPKYIRHRSFCPSCLSPRPDDCKPPEKQQQPCAKSNPSSTTPARTGRRARASSASPACARGT